MIGDSRNHPYVFQYPCHEATEEIKRYEIGTESIKHSWCIAANANVAVAIVKEGPTIEPGIMRSVLVYSLLETSLTNAV